MGDIYVNFISAISAGGAAITVALINNLFTIRHRKKDNILGRIIGIETNQDKLGNKIDLGNKGTMTGLKIQLQETYEKQYCRISSKNTKWSSDLDQVFREAYKAYKDLGGNGIVDRIKADMDIWRDKYAGDSFIDNEKKSVDCQNVIQ